MNAVFYAFLFLFGSAIGSFLNVVVFRYNTGRGLGGRSGCFSCGKKLGSWELLPVISYIFQGGRCRGCRAKISVQYPVVEVFAGLIFVGVFLKLQTVGETVVQFSNWSGLVYYLFIFCLLLAIAVYDFRHRIIPDGLVFLFSGLALIHLILILWSPDIFRMPAILDLLSGPIFAVPFFLLWYFSGGTLMGLGDAKLVLGIGWLLGIERGLTAIILAFWIGAGVSIFLMAVGNLLKISRFGRHFSMVKRLGLKSEVPFAPFLIASVFVVYFWNLRLFGF